jgi:ABC-type branched-subunit amino acid transport system substrate-binding protein
MDAVLSLPTLEALRGHVHAVLCRHDQLDPAQAPLHEELLTRAGQPCGLVFHVRGPRGLQACAIWAGEEGRVLFYDSAGQRFAQTSLAEAQRCVFSGVPAAGQMPSAATYVRQYRSAFHRLPGVWGSFTFDSAKILFTAINRAKSYDFGAVERALRQTKGYVGATGSITIDPRTGYRKTVPVSILRVDSSKRFVIAG